MPKILTKPKIDQETLLALTIACKAADNCYKRKKHNAWVKYAIWPLIAELIDFPYGLEELVGDFL